MARIRTVKQAFFLDWDLYQAEVVAALPLRLAFESLWPIADREGRFRWKAEELKPQCLPFDPVDFGACLMALDTGRFIRHYQIDGRCFGYIRTWSHQAPNERETKSQIPAPTVEFEAITCVHVHARGEREMEREGNGSGKGKGDSSEALTRSEPTPAPTCELVEAHGGLTTQGAVEQLRARAEDGPVILSFPTVGPQGAEWRLRRIQVEEWQGHFPALDVLAECRHALAWVRSHPDRRKTTRGMPKFLVGWLGRSNDRGGPSRTGGGPLGVKSTTTTAIETATQVFLSDDDSR